MNNDYWTMKELGQAVGLTSHEVGMRLKSLDLRTRDGKPSPMAFAKGFCSQRWTADGQHYCWAWHAERTMRLLRDEGRE